MPKKPESIWKDDDFKENAGVVIKDAGDDRPAPDYDILFKQSVGCTVVADLNASNATPLQATLRCIKDDTQHPLVSACSCVTQRRMFF